MLSIICRKILAHCQYSCFRDTKYFPKKHFEHSVEKDYRCVTGVRLEQEENSTILKLFS